MNALLQIAGWTLIHFIWQGAAIGVVAAAILRATSRRSANVRYVIACAGLLAMLAAPPATVWLLRPAIFSNMAISPANDAPMTPPPCHGAPEAAGAAALPSPSEALPAFSTGPPTFPARTAAA